MSFRDLEIKHSYISYGADSITTALINPALKHAKTYKRSVGFFSSSVLEPIIDGVSALVKNKGKIQLIASPQLSVNDAEAIHLGYEQRRQKVSAAFDLSFQQALEQFDLEELKILAELIARDYLDIKLAVTKDTGIYHDKLGILEDTEGNIIVFYGSANSSMTGYCKNYEKIRVVKSWVIGDQESVSDEIDEFDSLWNKTNPYVDVYDYREGAKANIIKTISSYEVRTKEKAPAIKLRDYQEEAIKAWVANNYQGFYVMATGTGKTWTAIYAAKNLVEKHSAMIVICAPYKHLVKQWAEDVSAAFPESKIILVSSENPAWETQLTTEIISKKYHPERQIIVISTIASFYMDRFAATIEKSKDDKLLIVDEAHRFTHHPDELHHTYKYMLGLSATPFSGKSAAKGNELMQFFGGQVFSLPIEDALEKKFLVPYYYHPIYVHATDEEEESFRYYSKKIASCFKNNKCINPDLLVKSLRARLRIISMAEEKQDSLDAIIGSMKGQDHFVVYCGDGRIYDSSGDELRHIQLVKKVLTEHEFRVSQFTAKENMVERMKLVHSFNRGDISALAAIRCLDEGINIPSIKSALILSSNDDYREFVQRRGRILRTYGGKESAHIYDVIVLPSTETIGWALIELRRFREYARLAKNCGELLVELDNLTAQYGISDEALDVYEYEDMEVADDE